MELEMTEIAFEVALDVAFAVPTVLLWTQAFLGYLIAGVGVVRAGRWFGGFGCIKGLDTRNDQYIFGGAVLAWPLYLSILAIGEMGYALFWTAHRLVKGLCWLALSSLAGLGRLAGVRIEEEFKAQRNK